MRRHFVFSLALAGAIVATSLAPAEGWAGVLDHFWGSGPPTLTEVARMIDHIQNSLLNQGTVVVKQPDIWSQARMTKFRKEFEDTMITELNTFQDKLAGQIARSDSASLQSQTSLAGVLNPFATGPGTKDPTLISTQTELATAMRNVPGVAVDQSTGQITNLPTLPNAFGTTAPIASTFSLLNQATTGSPGGLFTNPGLTLGLEPNIHLDEKADYLAHLHRIRRVNLGDDNSD